MPPNLGVLWLTTAAVVLYSQCHIGLAEGPVCFTCSYQLDKHCLDDPFSVKTGLNGNTVLRCQDNEVCVTRKVDYPATGIVQTMDRTCGIHDPTQVGCRTWIDNERRACTTQCDVDLCNDKLDLPEDGDSSDSGSSETNREDIPDGFDPDPVDTKGWYKVWVSSGGSMLTASHLLWLIACSYLLAHP